jgi:threonine dehydratase
VAGGDGAGALALTTERVEAARAAAADLVVRTPVFSSGSLSETLGGPVLLKAETLQRTGSFKLRGALSAIAALPARVEAVAVGSAGNHGQSVAYAARARGLRCEVHMPANAPVSKIAAVEAFGAHVRLGGSTVADCVERARGSSTTEQTAFLSPFDDPDVIAGQATLGVELCEQVPDLAQVVIPVGGGGLCGGAAAAIRGRDRTVRVVGVQVEACAAMPPSLAAGVPTAVACSPTIADGIAITRPGELTLPLIERHVDDIVLVDEGAVAAAMVFLLERAKLVTEGAGAVGVAALLAGALTRPSTGTTVIVLSGGNVDAGLLATLTRRHETLAGRRLRVFCRVPDRPGGLAHLLAAIADEGGNVLEVEHVREGVTLAVRETGVVLVLETRGADHAGRLLEGMAARGFVLERVGTVGR